MTTQFDGHILDFPGMTRSLALPVAAEPEGIEASAVVADVIAAFAPLVRPLTLDILLRAYHRETEEPVELTSSHWFASTLPVDPLHGITPSTEQAICRQVEALTPEVVGALIQEACAMKPRESAVACTWKEIRIYALEVRLPDALADREVLSLEVRGGNVGAQVERRSDGSWVSSVRSPGDHAPLELIMTGGLPKLRIITHWSLWTPGGPGEQDLDRVTDGLLARSWVRSRQY